jgi:hypothetical protein
VASFVRKVPTASGARAVQIVHKRGRRVERIEHVGSTHDGAELALLMEIARQRLHAGQGVLDFPATVGQLPGARIIGMRSRLVWDVLTRVYERLGFGALGDETFKALTLARVPIGSHVLSAGWDTTLDATGLTVGGPQYEGYFFNGDLDVNRL